MKSLKTQLIIAALGFAFALPVKAQNAIAKVKYEQTEGTYRQNDEAYTSTKDHKGANLEANLNEVYNFADILKQVPIGDGTVNQETARSKWLKTRVLAICDSLFNRYRVKNFATVEEFKTYTPVIFDKLVKAKGLPQDVHMYERPYKSKGSYRVIFDKNGFQLYECILEGPTTPEKAMKVYQQYLTLFPADIDKNWVERIEIRETSPGYETGFLQIKSPATNNRGHIRIAYSKYQGFAEVLISFYPQMTKFTSN